MESEIISLNWCDNVQKPYDGQENNLEAIQPSTKETWLGNEPLWPPQLGPSSPRNSNGHATKNDDAIPRTETIYDLDSLLNFEDHDNVSNKVAEDVTSFEDLLKGARYELRRSGLEAQPGFRSTWLDQDETGDFDLDEHTRHERQERLAKQRRARQARLRQISRITDGTARSDSEDEPKNAEISEQEPARLWLTLKLRDEVGKSLLRRLAELEPTLAEHDSFAQGYRLRRKQSEGQATGAYTSNVKIKDLPDDLTGWPEARGCWSCLLLGDHCPLLDDETQYPCFKCLEDSNDCELVQPPFLKRGCESCKQRRQHCSYNYTVHHGDSCLQCQEQGWHCVAGPLNDAIRRRVRYPDASSTASNEETMRKIVKPKHIITCERCQDAGRECSFNHGHSSSDICTACDMHGLLCKPLSTGPLPPQLCGENRVDLHLQRKRKHRETADAATSDLEVLHRTPSPAPTLSLPKEKIDVIELSDDDETPPTKQRAVQAHQAAPVISPESRSTQTVIRTKFSHPMKFNHETDAGVAKPCHFCAQPSFPLLGLEARDVFVLDHHDGSGYTELRGGHHAEGIESTRVCIKCTSQRMAVMMCTKHELRNIPRGDGYHDGGASAATAAPDLMAAFDRLMQGAPRAWDRWCSVCPALAVMECCAAQQAFDGDGGRVEWGCGLLLCEACGVLLSGIYGGSLDGMLREERDEPNDVRPFGLRADAELLKQDGLLLRYVLSVNGN